ncbi:hypothetical protein [Kutzneria buriramensis]|uniref:hypothetical protein n=1 Tax=Kutzneria buriramensis TaxID=1045776 RepID=UPI001B85BF24|nr:hypothetical protein [Kutzneria buriramensis]
MRAGHQTDNAAGRVEQQPHGRRQLVGTFVIGGDRFSPPARDFPLYRLVPGAAEIVCGGANNQLAAPGVDAVLADRDILYTPDYVANPTNVPAMAPASPT